MFQQFYTDTLVGRFIKCLLSKERISMFPVVNIGDTVVEGCSYLYKHYIVKAKITGKLSLKPGTVVSNITVPAEDLYISNGTHGVEDTLYFVCLSDETSDKTFYSYFSKTHWYDSETHYHLGNYLRTLTATKDLNLMPYYNCYNGVQLDTVQLFHKDGTVEVSDVNDSSHRVYSVPIKFNTKYTVATECVSPVIMKAVLWGTDGLYSVSTSPQNAESSISTFSDNGKIFSSTRFDKPILYEVVCGSENTEAARHERNLVLLIQTSSTCKVCPVVLEGDYTETKKVTTDKNHVIQSVVLPSLLSSKTQEPVAFSDRLVEYLFLNVIYHKETISGNISRCQEKLSKTETTYRNHFHHYGVWDEHMKYSVEQIVLKEKENRVLRDQDGNINKDVEAILWGK